MDPMRSMTAYAELIRPLGTGRLRLSLRSVNGKGLDLTVRALALGRSDLELFEQTHTLYEGIYRTLGC